MIRCVGMHRTNEAHVVDVLSGFGKDFTHFHATFTILLKRKWGGHRRSRMPFRRQLLILGERLAVILGQHWLRIEGVHLRGTAIQINMDDMLGLGRKLRLPGGQGRDQLGRSG